MFKLIPPGQGFERITEAVTTEFGALMDLVRQAIRDKLRLTPETSGYYVDIQGIWPDRVVVKLNGRTHSYPYTVGADNVITIGESTEVVATYTSVREAQAAGAALLAATGLATAGLVATFREAADGSIECTLIRAGLSGNGNFYPDVTLREAVPLFEGSRVFAKSDDEHIKGGGKDVRNLVGGIQQVRFVEGQAPDTGVLVGTFVPIVVDDPVVTKMREAVKRGLAGLMGLSIDADAKTRREQRGGKPVRVATKFVRVHSVDLIVQPGAGGGLDRLTEAAATDPTPEHPAGDDMLKARLIEALAILSAAAAAGLPADAAELLVVQKFTEACASAGVDPATAMQAALADDARAQLQRLVEAAKATPLDPQEQALREAQGRGQDAPLTRADLEMFRLRQTASASIAACGLPAAAIERLQADFGRRERFTEAEVTKAIADERAYIGRFVEGGGVNLPALARVSVEDRSVAIRDMLDAFFDPAHKNHREVRSFRECYVEITGDRRVSGELRDCDMGRLRESLGIERFAEAVISSTFANALGDSITRRMQAVFTGMTDLQTWRRVATWGPVSDFRTQERVRIGGYGNLPTVAQSGNYAALTSPSDEKATYAVAKRGGLETVTLEAIRNDDVQSLRRIPVEMGIAAANTLYEFVFDFYRTNPVIYDTVALYAAGHNNLFTAALDATTFAAHRLSMLKQTRAGSAKRLAAPPERILVPFDLQETAFNLFVRNQNNDKTFVQTINPEVIPVAYWTDTNDWVTVADPMKLPVLEIGFLDGREEPEVFVQDMPNVGSMFANDTITYKIRHIYGGNVLVDGFKGTTKAVVP